MVFDKYSLGRMKKGLGPEKRSGWQFSKDEPVALFSSPVRI
jgi:hypothetical protein